MNFTNIYTCPKCGLESAEVHTVTDYPDDHTAMAANKFVIVIRCHNCKAHTKGYRSESLAVANMTADMI